MLCTECFETSHPQTLLAGSDRIEMVGWLCLALPGWLYCAWRHALRLKVCGACGSSALVREARAAAVQASAAERAEPAPEVRNLCGRVLWPRPFSTPRERLLAGGPGVLASIAALLGSALAAAPGGGELAASFFLAASFVTAAAWMLHVTRRWHRARARLAGCRAWLPDGREIRIEPA